MKRIVLVFLLIAFACTTAKAQGLISVKSSYDVAATANRLEKVLHEKGITIFARIDHSQIAHSIGQALPPTLLIIFGHPAMGSPLIQRSRSMGIDLPLKALIWEDQTGQAWFSYNDPDYLFRRHGLTEMGHAVQQMQQALSGFAAAATQPRP